MDRLTEAQVLELGRGIGEGLITALFKILQHSPGETGFRLWNVKVDNAIVGWFAVTGPFPAEPAGFGLNKEKWVTPVPLYEMGAFELELDPEATMALGVPSGSHSARTRLVDFDEGQHDVPAAEGGVRALWRLQVRQNGAWVDIDAYLAVEFSGPTINSIDWYALPTLIDSRDRLLHQNRWNFVPVAQVANAVTNYRTATSTLV